MKGPYFALAFGVTEAVYARAQMTAVQASDLQEARFAISRGSNFTFQPATGSTCRWAVAQYPDQSTDFFDLASQLRCSDLDTNGTSTLRLRFGGNIEPGNVSLTVQCKEPSVYQFLISDHETDDRGSTSIESVCGGNDVTPANGNSNLLPSGSGTNGSFDSSMVGGSPATTLPTRKSYSGSTGFTTLMTAPSGSSHGYVDPSQNEALGTTTTAVNQTDQITDSAVTEDSTRATTLMTSNAQSNPDSISESGVSAPIETGPSIQNTATADYSGLSTTGGLISLAQPTTSGAEQMAPTEPAPPSPDATAEGVDTPSTTLDTHSTTGNQLGSATTTSCACTC